jgi:iron complex transport system substrate-binding protein
MREATAVVGAALVLVAAFGVTVPVAADTGGSGAGVSASVGADSHCSYPVTMTDATGTDVTIEEDPDRLVALAPSAAQILWEIGADEEVVGMPQDFYTGYLNGTEGKTDVVNDDGSVIAEAVVGSEPDLVLAPNVVSNETVESLRDSGLTVYRFENAEDLEDVYAKIELYGRLTGNYDEAGQVSARMQGQVEAVRACSSRSAADTPRVRTPSSVNSSRRRAETTSPLVRSTAVPATASSATRSSPGKTPSGSSRTASSVRSPRRPRSTNRPPSKRGTSSKSTGTS